MEVNPMCVKGLFCWKELGGPWRRMGRPSREQPTARTAGRRGEMAHAMVPGRTGSATRCSWERGNSIDVRADLLGREDMGMRPTVSRRKSPGKPQGKEREGKRVLWSFSHCTEVSQQARLGVKRQGWRELCEWWLYANSPPMNWAAEHRVVSGCCNQACPGLQHHEQHPESC